MSQRPQSPLKHMAGLQLSGLASGFDWKTLVDQLMAAERTPITRLTTEKTTNTSKTTALNELETKLNTLKTSVTALNVDGLFTARKAVSTTANSTWSSIAAAGTATGNYAIAVSQLATFSRRAGASDIGRPLNTTDDVSGLTLANLPTASAVTAGTFTVNGVQVSVALTDSLEQVFDAISTATSGAVTASYDHLDDTITLSGGGALVLGAANDTSNFLSAMKLSNNNSPTVVSSGRLGTVNKSAVLASARLAAPITAVDGSGNGSFSVNGVSIAYNVNTDSLSTVLGRINQSSAGVTASYDSSTDRVVLSNNVTGDIGVGVSEATGGLLDALGLTGGATLTRGNNAQYTINGGSVITSTSNNLDATTHGIEGLNVTVNTETTQTIAVSGDTEAMRTAIDSFITKFNDVQKFIDEKTKITTVNGKVTTSLLSSNREVQAWGSKLRSMAFGTISGLTGTINRLENLGIDFRAGTSELEVKNGITLNTALRDKAGYVAEFFQTNSTGFAESLEGFITTLGTSNDQQQERLTKANTDIDKQIETIERRLTQQRSILESSFIAMETAQSQMQSQSAALTKAFGGSTS